MTILNIAGYILNVKPEFFIQIGMLAVAVGTAWSALSRHQQKRYDDLEKRKADKEEVKTQLRTAHHRMDDIKESNKDEHEALRNEIKSLERSVNQNTNNRFDDLKDLIKANHK